MHSFPELAYRNTLLANSTAYIVAMLSRPKFKTKNPENQELNTILAIAINLAKAQLDEISRTELPSFITLPDLTDRSDVNH